MGCKFVLHAFRNLFNSWNYPCSMSDIAILLVSNLSTDQIQVVNSRRLEDAMIGRKVQFEKVDGSYPDNKELRDVLFGVSGQRGKYPQCFIKDNNGSYKFIGLWEEVESLIECDTLPTEVLTSNPQIMTFGQVNSSNCIIII